jgi:putative ABC transport system permease protein
MPADLRNALRALRATPAFTAVALIVLTLGIGASTAIFSVVDAVVLRALPFDEGDRLVAIGEVRIDAGGHAVGRPSSEAPQNFLAWRAQQDVFDGLAAAASTRLTLRTGDGAESLRVARVTSDLFHVLRVPPATGVPFATDNEVEGRHRVAVLSDSFWRRHFGADPHVVGKTLTLDEGVYDVVGVMPPGFRYPIDSSQPSDLYVPYVMTANDKVRGNSRSYYLQVVGRLKNGVTLDQARARIDQIDLAESKAFPAWFKGRWPAVMQLRELLVGQVRSWMLMLLGAVALVLLIACVNVANLMLVRATAREREMAVRAALGASRWQLIRGSLVESLVLSTIGTGLGLLLAWWGVGVLKASLPQSVPRLASIAVDLRVLLAAAGAAFVTGIVFGLAPAFQASRTDVTGALKEGGRGAAGSTRQRLRSALVVAEVTLAVLLLVGAGLFVSSFARLMHVDIGIDYDRVLTMPAYVKMDFNDKASRDAGMARVAQLIPQILERVRQIPGVEVASALYNGLPLSGSWSRTSVKVPGNPKEFGGDDSVDIRSASPDYPKAVHLPLRAGRFLTDADTATSAKVVVLNDVAAKKYFPDRDALGATIAINGDRTVVGIVGSIRLGGPETEVRPESYMAFSQNFATGGDLVVRTTGDPAAMVPAVKAAVHSLAPDITIPETETLRGYFDRLTAQRRFNMLLLSLFGGLGVVIAAVGIYGVMAYVVAQRTQEIGVRMALGAVPTQILRMVLGRASLYVVIGLVVGLGGAWALARFVQTFLFQVQPHDVTVYALVAVTLLVTGLVAAFVPARRAAKVDPLVALRME